MQSWTGAYGENYIKEQIGKTGICSILKTIIETNWQNWNRGYTLDTGTVLSMLNFPHLVTVLIMQENTVESLEMNGHNICNLL